MKGHVELTIDRKPIGRIEFDVVSYELATINITDIKLPDHAKLKKELIRHLTKNPEHISRAAARTPRDMGSFGDGLLAVLKHVQPKYGFEFDRQYIPLPNLKAGVIY